MFSRDCIDEIASVARAIDVEPAALLAVAEVESSGRPFALIDGRREPLIRFEGHYFDRRLSGDKRAMAREAGLASPTLGAVPNPIGQAARWRMLIRAAAIDRKAANESVSWGLGQVMGAHWAWLGYADVAALVTEVRGSVAGQARLMGRFIQRAGLADALRNHDWPAFARGYNGPAFARNGYDTKLKRAYAGYASRMAGMQADTSSALGSDLRQGNTGARVESLQRSLCALGYALRCDGIFGPATKSAVIRFQMDRSLAQDGIAGRETLASIEKALARRSTSSWWIGAMRRLLRWVTGG